MNDKRLTNGIPHSASLPVYPATIGGITRYVSIPGSGPKVVGPQSELEVRSFLVRAIEASAELEDLVQPSFRQVPSDEAFARDAGMSDDEVGFVVSFGLRRYLVRISEIDE